MTVPHILAFENLDVSFQTDEGLVKVLDQVSFTLGRGRTLGLVGESGSGKSVSTRCAVQLNAKNVRIGPQSHIVLNRRDGTQSDLLTMGAKDIRKIRGGEIGMIFQEPMAAFSPVYTIGNQMIEAIRLHRTTTKKAARTDAIEMLRKVGMSSPEQRIDQYPGELSGGMRQRAMIALALSTNPRVLIADEPTTALDVTIQAQVLDLMRTLQSELDMSILFITHDLGVVSQVAHDIAVMYLGRVVEAGQTRSVLKNPQHPYTKGLLNALPAVNRLKKRLSPIGGDIPGPLERPTGCPFHTRCAQAIAGLCDHITPPPTEITAGHKVSCHLMTP